MYDGLFLLDFEYMELDDLVDKDAPKEKQREQLRKINRIRKEEGMKEIELGAFGNGKGEA